MKPIMTMPDNADGRILSSLGGTYDVETRQGRVNAVPRGIFRKRGITPVVGDWVRLGQENVIEDILPRRNEISRPPTANLDRIFFVTSMKTPAPNITLLDSFLAVAQYQHITPAVILTKIDLADHTKLQALYEKAGIDVYPVDYQNPSTIEAIRELLRGSVTMMTGNSGAGKSTLLNALDPNLHIEVAAISKKLGRGRHTTRKVELYPCAGGYIADTPGFSSFEIDEYVDWKPEEIADCFPDFAPYIGQCRFHDCAHVKEKGCAVLQALHDGEISPSRHESYVSLYTQAKEKKSWEK